MTEEQSEQDRLVAEVAAAYLSRNEVAPERIPEVFRIIRAALLGMEGPTAPEQVPTTPAPASAAAHIDPQASIQDDHITCLICGNRSSATLKRHLRAAHGMHEHDYRRRFGIDEKTPLTARNYSSRRSEIAKKMHQSDD